MQSVNQSTNKEPTFQVHAVVVGNGILNNIAAILKTLKHIVKLIVKAILAVATSFFYV